MGKASRRKRMFRTGEQVYAGPVPRVTSPRDLLIGMVLLILLLGWVGYLLFGEVSKVWTVTTSADWPAVQGEVLGRRVEQVSGSRGRAFFHPVVEYRYSVGGRTYSSATYRLNPRAADGPDEAERLIAPYTAGSRVQVFYNPDAPGEAYLVPGFLTGRDYLALAVSAVMFVLLLAITVLVLLPEPKPLRLRKAGRSAG
ncbi:MAG: hypothetical protein OHK0022_23290 [Roseiflexaceae bacterium]